MITLHTVESINLNTHESVDQYLTRTEHQIKQVIYHTCPEDTSYLVFRSTKDNAFIYVKNECGAAQSCSELSEAELEPLVELLKMVEESTKVISLP